VPEQIDIGPLASLTFDREHALASLEGDIDLSNADLIEGELLRCAPSGAPGLVVDLGGLDHLDSSGIRLLFRLADQFAATGQQLRVVVPEENSIRRILQIAAFDRAVPPDENAADAVRALGL
jgi:anti-anti-sigma factor